MPEVKTGPAGTWTIAAAQATNGQPYSGTVQIHPMGQIYTVSWLTTIGDYSGLAFFENGHLFAGSGSGDTYGITVYKIGNDGTLDGKWTTPPNQGVIDSERAVNGIPGQLEGSYQIGGTSLKSGNYQGELNIRQSNDIYRLFWSVGTQYQGIGLRVDDWLVTTWGIGNVYILYYEIEARQANGRWAASSQSVIGKEKLERIC